MDERTRTTDDDLTPRPAAEHAANCASACRQGAPVTATRIGIGLIIVVLLALGAYQIGRWVHGRPRRRPDAWRSSRAAIGRRLDGRDQGNIRVIVNALGTVTPIATVTVQTQISG